MIIYDAYILAGGRSSRMGTDKLFLNLKGGAMLFRTLKTLAECFSRVTIVAKESGKFAPFDNRVVIDSPLVDGPMGGLIAALEDSEGDACFVTAADLYDLDRQIITTLTDNYDGEDYLGIAETGHVQPLCGVYSVRALPVLIDSVQRGESSPAEVLKRMDYRLLDLNLRQWRNLNQPSDLLGEIREVDNV